MRGSSRMIDWEIGRRTRRGWDVGLEGKGASWFELLPISSKASARRKHRSGWNWHREKKVRYVTNFGYVPLLFSCASQRPWIYPASMNLPSLKENFVMSEVWQPYIICLLNFIHMVSQKYYYILSHSKPARTLIPLLYGGIYFKYGRRKQVLTLFILILHPRLVRDASCAYNFDIVARIKLNMASLLCVIECIVRVRLIWVRQCWPQHIFQVATLFPLSNITKYTVF
jgi:hypothetical protein